MTNPEISEEAKAKAIKEVGYDWKPSVLDADPAHLSGLGSAVLAFARYIQTTSDVAKWLRSKTDYRDIDEIEALDPLILPEPKDPLEGAMEELGWCNTVKLTKDLRAELKRRNLQITPIK